MKTVAHMLVAMANTNSKPIVRTLMGLLFFLSFLFFPSFLSTPSPWGRVALGIPEYQVDFEVLGKA